MMIVGFKVFKKPLSEGIIKLLYRQEYDYINDDSFEFEVVFGKYIIEKKNDEIKFKTFESYNSIC